MKEKFYQKDWFLWLTLILIPPAGLLLLWIFRKNDGKKKKGILSLIFAGWTLTLLFSNAGTGNLVPVVKETPFLAAKINADSTPSSDAARQRAGSRSKTEKEASSASKSESNSASELEVHFLDVGQGLSIFAQSDGQTLLYDGGDREASSFTVSYLQSQGVAAIDYLISSHYDEDHLAGLVGCLNVFEVRNILCADYVHDTKLYHSFVSLAEKRGIQLQHPAVGDEFPFGDGQITVLAPETISSESNDNSVAVKLENGENVFLFTGDAAMESEAAMCASGINLEADVLSLSHHGSATATSWDFLQAATPEYAVLSCGDGNSYGHPDKDVMDKLQDMEIPLFRNDKQGTIVAKSDGNTIQWDQTPCNDYSPGSPSDTGTTPPETDAPRQKAAALDAPAPQHFVWKSKTGEKYHSIPDCGQMNPNTASQITEEEARALGLSPCKKCR